MKAETQGKLMVAMVVSILAFGFGTGTILVAGHYQTKNSPTINTTQQSDFPSVTNSRQNNVNNTSSSSSSSGQSNQQNNNPSTSHNNTTSGNY